MQNEISSVYSLNQESDILDSEDPLKDRKLNLGGGRGKTIKLFLFLLASYVYV